MLENTSSTTEAPQRKWLGVLLSLFVPGFGLIRAGHIWRGVVWFVAVQVIWVFALLLAIWRSIPSWVVFAGFAIALGCQLVMLGDSFRPGKLNARLCLIFAAAFFAVICLPPAAQFFSRAFRIATDGMAPTLRGCSHGPADEIIADRLCYMLSPPKRGDLVVFHLPDGAMTKTPDDPPEIFFFQRLVGLPGEKIEIRDGHVLADGRQLGESDGIPEVHYTTAPPRPLMPDSRVYEVPHDAYFMLGDNSPHSYDSRYWGYLPAANIYARVSRIYYPFSRVGVPQ